MSGTKRRWHVFAVEWLSHDAFIEAATKEEAIALAQQLWADNAEHQLFSFCDSGLESVTAYEE